MNRYIIILTVLFVAIAAVMGIIFLLWPSAPVPSQQQGGGTSQPVSSTVSVSPDPSVRAVQAAYQAELAKHESDNTKLYETSIVGEYALQVWAGDVMGGQALLKYDRNQARWVLLDGGGGAWSIETLTTLMGVPQDIAVQLLAGLPQ